MLTDDHPSVNKIASSIVDNHCELYQVMLQDVCGKGNRLYNIELSTPFELPNEIKSTVQRQS